MNKLGLMDLTASKAWLASVTCRTAWGISSRKTCVIKSLISSVSSTKRIVWIPVDIGPSSVIDYSLYFAHHRNTLAQFYHRQASEQYYYGHSIQVSSFQEVEDA